MDRQYIGSVHTEVQNFGLGVVTALAIAWLGAQKAG
jgi:hypothetical protein